MGAGPSVAFHRELALARLLSSKPHDTSDVTTFEAARAELKAVRRSLRFVLAAGNRHALPPQEVPSVDTVDQPGGSDTAVAPTGPSLEEILKTEKTFDIRMHQLRVEKKRAAFLEDYDAAKHCQTIEAELASLHESFEREAAEMRRAAEIGAFAEAAQHQAQLAAIRSDLEEGLELADSSVDEVAQKNSMLLNRSRAAALEASEHGTDGQETVGLVAKLAAVAAAASAASGPGRLVDGPPPTSPGADDVGAASDGVVRTPEPPSVLSPLARQRARLPSSIKRARTPSGAGKRSPCSIIDFSQAVALGSGLFDSTDSAALAGSGPAPDDAATDAHLPEAAPATATFRLAQMTTAALESKRADQEPNLNPETGAHDAEADGDADLDAFVMQEQWEDIRRDARAPSLESVAPSRAARGSIKANDNSSATQGDESFDEGNMSSGSAITAYSCSSSGSISASFRSFASAGMPSPAEALVLGDDAMAAAIAAAAAAEAGAGANPRGAEGDAPASPVGLIGKLLRSERARKTTRAISADDGAAGRNGGGARV
jgi:hypothetical protein